MGTTQSVADEQKTTALFEENERLREELKRLKVKLGETDNDSGVYSSDNVDSGADSGVDSGREDKGPVEEGYTISDEDNMSVDELISRGLRLQPLFDDKGQCVELVATVVDDITSSEQNKKKKHKTRKPKKSLKLKDLRRNNKRNTRSIDIQRERHLLLLLNWNLKPLCML